MSYHPYGNPYALPFSHPSHSKGGKKKGGHKKGKSSRGGKKGKSSRGHKTNRAAHNTTHTPKVVNPCSRRSTGARSSTGARTASRRCVTTGQ